MIPETTDIIDRLENEKDELIKSLIGQYKFMNYLIMDRKVDSIFITPSMISIQETLKKITGKSIKEFK